MPNVCIINSSEAYQRMFESMGWNVVRDFGSADLVQFTGGSDVSPSLYGEAEHPYTSTHPARDEHESDAFDICMDMGIPMAGICRGAQFLNVMSGGSLWQDVDNHAIYGVHAALDLATERMVDVTSTHHQMMRVGVNGEVLVEAYEASYYDHMKHGKVEQFTELAAGDVEVVYYGATKCLCFQPHPELHGAESTRTLYFELLQRHLGLS